MGLVLQRLSRRVRTGIGGFSLVLISCASWFLLRDTAPPVFSRF